MMRSLGSRLVVAALVFLTIALFLTWLFLTQLFENHVARQTERELQAIADTLIANLAVKNGKLQLLAEPTDPRYAIPAGGRYWEVDGISGGDARSRSLWDTDIGKPGATYAGSKLSILPGPSGGDLLVLTTSARFEFEGKQLVSEIHAASDKSELDEALAGFRGQLLSMLLMTGSLLAVASGLQVFVGLRPLKNLRRAVYSLRQGETQAIDSVGPAEVRPLILEINTLMADGRAAVERARMRASDLAHGLKTPLTILGQIGELLERQGDKSNGREVEEQVNLIRSRVDRQLALARTGNQKSEILEVHTAVNRLLNVTRTIAAQADIQLTNKVPAAIKIQCDATDFLEALGNIVDNAIRHAKSSIVVTGQERDRLVHLSVSDDGPGIDEGNYQKALERGFRLDESTQGNGLGMAISSDILRAYGGSISLQRSDMGGLTVNLSWPQRQGLRIKE